MRHILGFLFVIQTIYSAPSSFGAGDLSKENPYGLSPSEKFILKNKQNVKKLQQTSVSQKQVYTNIQNDISVLREMFVSSSTSINQNNNNFNKIFVSIDKNITDILLNSQYQNDEIEKLKDKIEALSSSNEILKTSLFALKDIILNINNSFVSKEELEDVKKSITQKKKNNKKKKLSLQDIQKKAHKLYKKKKYSEASKNYKILVKNKYRPANSNFRLGEIAYYQKKYKSSIKYYTTSVALYDKAKYMPTLLYHTAISYIRTKDKKNAKPFLNAIMQNFPKSKEARLAKKELGKF